MDFYIVDCFAEQKYQGNQLAVFTPDHAPSAAEMQQIAHEMHFSETTFILSGRRDNGGYDVRIFTPDVEIPFAGHPTLGTAYVIQRFLEPDPAQCRQVLLNLGVGTIPVAIDDTGLVMQQNQPEFGQIVAKEAVAGALSIDDGDVDDALPVQVVSTGLPCVVVPLRSVAALQRCSIHHDRFQRLLDTVCKCNLLVFARAGDDELRVRVFMDDTGFLEDPATGSANGNLAGYLLKYNCFGQSSVRYNVRQGCEINRPSLLRVRAALSDGRYTIAVGGQVHLVAKGHWLAG